MDREQVNLWAREADAYMHRYCETNWYAPEEQQEIRDEHFARLVRNAALEEAKDVCESIACLHLNDAISAANAGYGDGSERHDAMRCGAEDCEDAIASLIAEAVKA